MLFLCRQNADVSIPLTQSLTISTGPSAGVKKKKCNPNLGLVQDFYFKILRIFPNLRPFFQTKLPLMAEGGRKPHCSWWFTDLNQGSKWFQFKHNKVFIFLQSSIVWPPSSLPNLLLQIICWPCQYHHIPKLFKTFTPQKAIFLKTFQAQWKGTQSS